MTLEPRVFASVAIPIGPAGLGERDRATIVVEGLEQAGPSFELRVFVNNPRADADTECDARSGYAGSIHMYGYGEQLPPSTAAPQPGSHVRLPITRQLTATDAIRAAASEGSLTSVTLVPVAYQGPTPKVDLSDVRVSVLVHE